MPSRTPPVSPDGSRVQSWLDDIRPGSAGGRELKEELLEPALIALPRSNSTRSTLRTVNTDTSPECHPQEAHTQNAAVATPTISHNSHSRHASSQAQAGATGSNTGANTIAASVSHDSLWQLQNVDEAAELRIPLPSSKATSVATVRPATSLHTHYSRISLQGASVDSLLQLQNAGSPAELRIPLPESFQTKDEEVDYWTSIEPLLECLPDLRAVSPLSGRHKTAGSITCMDYMRGQLDPDIHKKLRPSKGFKQAVQKLKQVDDAEIITRVILVEDLSSKVIESIGSVFEVDPEFFAEHLNRSGYDRMDYADPLPNHWMPKAHVSLKWYRPVKQHPKIAEWMKLPKELLEPEKQTNLDETSMTERASPGSISWSDPAFNADGKRNKTAKLHQASITTNIFRRCQILSTRPSTRIETPDARTSTFDRSTINDSDGSLTSATTAFETDWNTKAIPTAWEERASFLRYDKGVVPIILLILDPLPSISDFQAPIKSRRRKRSPSDDVEDVAAKIEVQMEMSLPVLSRLPPQLPANKFRTTSKDIQSLKKTTQNMISTADAIRAQSETVPEWEAFEADPILALLRVVQIDFKAFFSSLEWALDEISEDSLDDYLISRRMDDWRKLMNDFQIGVPAIGKSLHEFVTFIFQGGTKLPPKIEAIINEVNVDIERIESRLDKAYTALRADMQFSESRRSINEAKSVAKLTELAFIFIPLSFTASLFSMSIHELDNGVPAWTFILTSLGMALLAYGVRLLLTSEFLAQSSRSALERFWISSGVERGTDAPVFTIALLTLQEIWHRIGAKLLGWSLGLLFLGSLIIVPAALAWTSTNLDLSFHVVVFLFLVLSSLLLALGTFYSARI